MAFGRVSLPDITDHGPALGVVLPRLAAAVGRPVEQAEGPVGRFYSTARRGVGEEHAVAVAKKADEPADRLLSASHRVVPGLCVSGLHNLPSKSFTTNRAWMLTANLACDLDAWLRLLALHDQDGLADAEPETMRFRIYHLPARLAAHARRRWVRIERTWPWADAFTTPVSPTSPDRRPAPTKTERRTPAPPRNRGNRRSRSDTRRPHQKTSETKGRTDHLTEQQSPLTNRGQDHIGTRSNKSKCEDRLRAQEFIYSYDRVVWRS